MYNSGMKGKKRLRFIEYLNKLYYDLYGK